MYVDSHCHLDFPELAAELPALLSAMRENAVTHALCIGVDLPAWPNVVALAREHANLYATVGVHPDYTDTPEPSVAELVELSTHAQGGGHRRDRARLLSPRRRPGVAARALSPPHPRGPGDRQAAGHPHAQRGGGHAGDHARGTRRRGRRRHALLHRILGSRRSRRWTWVSTFPSPASSPSSNAVALKDVARRVPLDRMLIETDSPYLAPMPFRGKRNQPAWVRHVGEEVARLRGVPAETVAAATSANFFRLFSIAAHEQTIAA